MKSRDRQIAWWVVVVVLVAFTAAQTYQVFRVPMYGPNDIHAKGSQVLKYLYPDLYQDEVFGSLQAEQVHPPVFFLVVGGLTRLTGSPDIAMGLLVPIVYLVFMFGMFRLFVKLGIAWPVALGAALLSTVDFRNTGVWGFDALKTAVLRNWHVAVFPWIMLVGWPLLTGEVRGRPAHQAVIFGLAVGLAANLHPTSGYALAEVVGFLLLLRLVRGEIRLGHLGAYVLGGLLGVSPYLVHLYGSRGAGDGALAGSVDFQRYLAVVKDRIQFAFPYPDIRVAGHILTANEQVWLVWIYLALTLTAAFFFIRAWKRGQAPGNILLISFDLIQLGMAWILTVDRDRELVLIALIYLVARAITNRLDRVDQWLMEFMTACFLLGFALGGWLLELLWRTTQAISLTPFVTEQGRPVRLVFFSLLVFLARFADWAWRREEASPRVAVVLAGLAVFVLPSGNTMWVVLAMVALGLMFIGVGGKDKPRWAESLLIGVVGAIVCRLLFTFLGLEGFDVQALLAGAATAGIALLWRSFPHHRQRYRLGASLGAALICAAGLFILPGAYSGQPSSLATAVFRVPDQIRQNWAIQRLNVNQAYLDEYELSQWAAQNTEAHSLFYYDGVRFRFWSRRNLTHGRKEIGLAINTGAADTAIALYDRYQLFEAGYQDPALLKELVAEDGVDYVVFQPAQDRMEDLPAAWTVVFENDRYTVYKVVP